MKRHLLRIPAILAIVFLFACNAAKAQQTFFLNVDSIFGIPDTIYNGETITFNMVFSNQSALGFQGEVTAWLQVQGAADTIPADSTTWGGGNFIQAQSQTVVEVTHIFSTQDNNLSIGDNVVVVWPRINTGTVFPPQEVINKGFASFYLAEPLGIDPIDKSGVGRLSIYPNPAQGNVRISGPNNEILTSVRITDMMGRNVVESAQITTSLAIESLPHGIYTVQATTAKGAAYAARMVVQP